MFRFSKFFTSVRYGLAAINGIFLLTGLLVLSVGIAVLVSYKEYELFLTQRFFTLPGFVIATGIIILLGSILGFYSAYSAQFYFILGYAALTLVVLVFEIASVATGFSLRNDSTSQIRRPMQETLQQYESRRDVAIMWDTLQRGFECCGVAGRHDWAQNQFPISCCHIDYGTVSPFVCNTGNAHTTGCASALGTYLGSSAQVLAVSVLVATILQVLISGAAGWLAYRAKYEEVELES